MPIAVILTALSVEYLAVRHHLSDVCEEVHPEGTVYERGQFVANAKTWQIAIVEVGKGNSSAAVEAERIVQHFNPDVAIFVGIAGGLKDVEVGDVVAATKVYRYESGKAETIFHPRPELHGGSYPLVQRARAAARSRAWHHRISDPPSRPPQAFIEPIAAGESVVASRKSDAFQS